LKNVFWDVTPGGSCKKYVSEEGITSIIWVTLIGGLEETLAVTSNRSMLRRNTCTVMMEAICSSETSVLTRGVLRSIKEDGFLHTYSRENLKTYKKKNCSLLPDGGLIPGQTGLLAVDRKISLT
jgi:hypothetical protein